MGQIWPMKHSLPIPSPMWVLVKLQLEGRSPVSVNKDLLEHSHAIPLRINSPLTAALHHGFGALAVHGNNLGYLRNFIAEVPFQEIFPGGGRVGNRVPRI